MKKSQKQVVSEMDQMAYLMGYDRGKTIFEQQKGHNTIIEARQPLTESDAKLLNEGFPWLAAGVLGGGGLLVSWLRGDTMSDSEKVNIALDPEAWPEIEKTLNDISYSAGYDITDKMTIKSASEAKNGANRLFDAMDGGGTNESKIRSVINSCKSVLDMARITYEFGTREDWTLKMWFTKPYWGVKELSSSEFSDYVEGPIESEPFAIFDGKNYENGEEFLTAVGKYVESEAACEEGFEKNEDGECVKVEEEVTVNTDVDWTLVTMNGETMDFDYEMDPQTKSIYDKYIEAGYAEKYTPEFLFAYSYDKAHQGDGTDYYIEYPGDGKQIVAGGELTERYGGNKGDESRSRRDYEEGTYGGNKGDESRSRRDYEEGQKYGGNKGDESRSRRDYSERQKYGGNKGDESRSRRDYAETYGGNKGDESRSERDFEEGGVGRKGGKRVKNVDYNATDTTDTSGDVKSTRETRDANYTLEQIKNGTAVAKRGDKGGVVKSLQNLLMQAGGSLPKYGADGDYGSETEAAVKAFQTKNGLGADGEIGKKTYDAMTGGGTTTTTKTDDGKVASSTEKVTKADENEIDKITIQKEKSDPETIDDQIGELNSQVSKQPTKEKCKTLIASAAAGIKRGVTLQNTDSLAQCYNSYNFGWGGKSRKVRKFYNLKTHGN
jgi:peptidoglycan hydrolase-like protein with peptidoglycan-binding domain